MARGPDAVDAFKESLAYCIADACGCSKGRYDAPSMEAAHAGPGIITRAEYDAFIERIAGVLASNGGILRCFASSLVDPVFVATIIGR